jgi:hypothetical protein
LFYGDHLQDFCSASEGPQIEIQFCAQNIWPKSAPYLQAHPQSHNYPLHAFNLIETAALCLSNSILSDESNEITVTLMLSARVQSGKSAR